MVKRLICGPTGQLYMYAQKLCENTRLFRHIYSIMCVSLSLFILLDHLYVVSLTLCMSDDGENKVLKGKKNPFHSDELSLTY